MERKQLLPLRSNASDRHETYELLVLGLPPFANLVAQEVARHPEDLERRRVVVSDTLENRGDSPTDAPVDMICFVVSMHSKLSLERAKQALQEILPEERVFFSLGRWVLVVLDTNDSGKFTFDLAETRGFSETNGIPILFGSSSQDHGALCTLAGRVVRLLARAARDRGISPLLSYCHSVPPPPS